MILTVAMTRATIAATSIAALGHAELTLASSRPLSGTFTRSCKVSG
jgi:hypothetical protein